MVKVTTIEQARALPDAPPDYIDSVDERGYTVRTRVPQKYYRTPTDGDQIIFFLDSDGRMKRVIYTEDGPAKDRWP